MKPPVSRLVYPATSFQPQTDKPPVPSPSSVRCLQLGGKGFGQYLKDHASGVVRLTLIPDQVEVFGYLMAETQGSVHVGVCEGFHKCDYRGDSRELWKLLSVPTAIINNMEALSVA